MTDGTRQQGPDTAETRGMIAYFTMEIGLQEAIPTYAGGLGVLAGDTVRSAADLELPMVAVSLLYRKGNFRQTIDPDGVQREEPAAWNVGGVLAELQARCSLELEGRTVHLRVWQYEVKGVTGASVPVYMLDADLPENAPQDRALTDSLYGGDARHRLCQEAILGIGGARMLRALGYRDITRFHMNEGHAALLSVELMHELAAKEAGPITTEIVQRVKAMCVFTTHTPVSSGHDQFPLPLVEQVITGYGPHFHDLAVGCCLGGVLNMTYLALDHSHYINGVAKRHGEISQHMFARYKIDAITNGVHLATWAAAPMQALFDRHIAGWRRDNASLRYALGIPKQELWSAHQAAKQQLIRRVNKGSDAGLDSGVFTLGFARRMTAYKRPDLLLTDVERLVSICDKAGPMQIIYSGKAHPDDGMGKDLIKRIFRTIRDLRGRIPIVYLEDYDIATAKLMVAGVDVWLNTPQPPLEASGTSGMKAAVNGVPSLSVLDGWWVEGCIEDVTGWAIGDDPSSLAGKDDGMLDAESLYGKLEFLVLPLFYRNSDRFIDVMRHAIALNASFFNTERMVDQYVTKAYFK